MKVQSKAYHRNQLSFLFSFNVDYECYVSQSSQYQPSVEQWILSLSKWPVDVQASLQQGTALLTVFDAQKWI